MPSNDNNARSSGGVASMTIKSGIGFFFLITGMMTMTKSVLPFTRWFIFSLVMMIIGCTLAIGNPIQPANSGNSKYGGTK